MESLLSIENNKNNRLEEIDFLRGFVMVLVFLHHSGCIFGKVILAFHMPFFFVLSGYLFSLKDRTKQSFSKFFIKNFKRLILTYYIFEIIILLISYLFSFIFNLNINFLQALKSIFLVINNDAYHGISLRLWFLPCIFLCNIFVFTILKNTSRNKLFTFICCIFFFFLSFIFNYFFDFRLPFTLDISFMGTAFMLLGYSLSKAINYLIYDKKIIIKIFVFLVFSLAFIYFAYNNSPFFMYIDDYGNFLYAIIASISGVVLCFIAIPFIYNFVKKNNFEFIIDYVVWVGKNSILLFPVHLILLYLLDIFKIYWIVKFLLICILVVPVIYLLNKTKLHDLL